MKVLDILDESITDGDGIRTVIFLSGCSHGCKGCHNPESWNINNGVDMSIEEILERVEGLYDITLSGGDPLYQAKDTIDLARMLKSKGNNIWLYTGYTYDQITQKKEFKEILNHIDVLVDGRFDINKKDLSLPFRGSSNQNIIYLEE